MKKLEKYNPEITQGYNHGVLLGLLMLHNNLVEAVEELQQKFAKVEAQAEGLYSSRSDVIHELQEKTRSLEYMKSKEKRYTIEELWRKLGEISASELEYVENKPTAARFLIILEEREQQEQDRQ